MPLQNLPKLSKPQVRFWRAAGMFQDTKQNKVWRNNTARTNFSGMGGFMDTKRQNPQALYGSSDKLFRPDGKFGKKIQGIRHAHITHDLSIVYKVVGNNIFLYGFFTHDDLGTGTPANTRRQDAMSSRFANAEFLEETKD